MLSKRSGTPLQAVRGGQPPGQELPDLGLDLETFSTSQLSGLQTQHLLSIDQYALHIFRTIEKEKVPRFASALTRVLSKPSSSEDSYLDQVISCQAKVIEGLLTRILTDRAGNVDHEIPPRPLQALVLTRLVFARKDVLLVAQTGFGKSLIFQAYGLFTGLITIIVVPLLGLCDQCLTDIESIPGCRPIAITAETRRQYTKTGKDSIFNIIAKGSYTHIVLGPEQLMDPDFRALIRDEAFRKRLGILVIDEAHCVAMWSSFRSDYAQIHAFRRLLPRTVVMFACTATLSPSIQSHVVTKSGFDLQADWDERTGVIRTSIDRPDISIILVSLPKQNLKSGILFAVRCLETEEGRQSLEEHFKELQTQGAYLSLKVAVEMTVIFATTRAEVREVKEYVRGYLCRQGCRVKTAQFLVRSYTSRTAKPDRLHICNEMQKGQDSTIKILVATSAFGMGLNIQEIKNVVQFRGVKFRSTSRIAGDIVCADIMQRGGRAARKSGLRGSFYICLDADIKQKEERWRANQSKRHDKQTARVRAKALRSQANKSQPKRFNADDSVASQHGSDIEDDPVSDASESSAESDLADDPAAACFVEQITGDATSPALPVEQESAPRNYSFSWTGLRDTPCKRKFLWTFLGEDLFQGEQGVLERADTAPELCCSGCNKDLIPELIEDVRPFKETKPRAGSAAAICLSFIKEWASQTANSSLPTGAGVRAVLCRFPGTWVIPERIQWKLAYHLYVSGFPPRLKWGPWNGVGIERTLAVWKNAESLKSSLETYLNSRAVEIEEAIDETRSKNTRSKKQDKSTPSTAELLQAAVANSSSTRSQSVSSTTDRMARDKLRVEALLRSHMTSAAQPSAFSKMSSLSRERSHGEDLLGSRATFAVRLLSIMWKLLGQSVTF